MKVDLASHKILWYTVVEHKEYSMPYSGPDDKSLPSNVKKMPLNKKKQWVHVWNSAFSSCMKKDGASEKECESSAFAQANGVAKNDFFIDGLLSFWDKLKDLVKTTEDRAINIPDIYAQLSSAIRSGEEWAYITDLYVEDGNNMFAVVAKEGKLYKVPFTIDFSKNEVTVGTWQQVLIEFKPVSNNIILRETEQGTRFIQMACTSVLNRNGMIDSTALFDKIIERFDLEDKPYVDFFHLGKDFSMGSIDYVDRDGNVLITSGLFDESELANLMKAAIVEDPEFWGNSISFLPISSPEMLEVSKDISIPVYTDGRLIASTFLPEKDACSLFTAARVKQENNMVAQRVKDALSKLVKGDEELLNKFVAMVDGVNRTVEDENLIHRETETATETVVEPVVETISNPTVIIASVEESEKDIESVETPEEDKVIEIDEEVVAALKESVFADDRFSSLQSSLDGINESLKKLVEQSTKLPDDFKVITDRISLLEVDDETKKKQWQQDLPRKKAVSVTYRVRETKEEEPSTQSLDEVAEETLSKILN